MQLTKIYFWIVSAFKISHCYGLHRNRKCWFPDQEYLSYFHKSYSNRSAHFLRKIHSVYNFILCICLLVSNTGRNTPNWIAKLVLKHTLLRRVARKHFLMSSNLSISSCCMLSRNCGKYRQGIRYLLSQVETKSYFLWILSMNVI